MSEIEERLHRLEKLVERLIERIEGKGASVSGAASCKHHGAQEIEFFTFYQP